MVIDKVKYEDEFNEWYKTPCPKSNHGIYLHRKINPQCYMVKDLVDYFARGTKKFLWLKDNG